MDDEFECDVDNFRFELLIMNEDDSSLIELFRIDFENGVPFVNILKGVKNIKIISASLIMDVFPVTDEDMGILSVN